MNSDQWWMYYALCLADKAQRQNEVPVGAVLTKQGQLLGLGWNQPISTSDPSAHAEIQAIRSACHRLDNYRLPDTTLYVTLEPCSMCAGAIIHSRISRLVYAADEPKTGAISRFNFFSNTKLNHRITIESGLFSEQSSLRLRRFFQARR